MKKILVFGGGGLVGSKFIDLNRKSFEIIAPSVSKVDIVKKDQIEKSLEEGNPDCVMNFAAITDVEGSEREKDYEQGVCFQVNAIGARNVARVCKQFDKKLIHISTEYVFDGTKVDSPYTEQDRPNPINWYGMTKLFGEEYVLKSGCQSTIIRISMPYSSIYPQKKDIARFFLDKLRKGNQVNVVDDQRITPTLVDDIGYALKVLIDSENSGIYHVSVTDSVTPLEFAKMIARAFNLNYSLINSISFNEYNKNKKGKLLKYSWLNPAKFEKEFGDQIVHKVKENIDSFKKIIDAKVNN